MECMCTCTQEDPWTAPVYMYTGRPMKSPCVHVHRETHEEPLCTCTQEDPWRAPVYMYTGRPMKSPSGFRVIFFKDWYLHVYTDWASVYALFQRSWELSPLLASWNVTHPTCKRGQHYLTLSQLFSLLRRREMWGEEKREMGGGRSEGWMKEGRNRESERAGWIWPE